MTETSYSIVNMVSSLHCVSSIFISVRVKVTILKSLMANKRSPTLREPSLKTKEIKISIIRKISYIFINVFQVLLTLYISCISD